MKIRQWARQRGVWWHAQNLTDGERGPMWQAGRAWFRVSRGDGDSGKNYQELFAINPEWHFGWDGTFGVAVTLGGGDSSRDVQLNVDVGLARIFLTFDGMPRAVADRILPGYWIERNAGSPPYKYQHYDRGAPDRLKVNHAREVEVKWHSGGLWWSFWHPTMEWDSKTPKWRNGHFDPIDWLFGGHVYSAVDLSTEPVEVPMPEKTYPATVRLFESIWKRPRWPFARRMVRADISVEGGIPHPGKGENSWDCDDDATYSLTCQARTAEDAVSKLVGSVLRARRRYGGQHWRPQDRMAVQA